MNKPTLKSWSFSKLMVFEDCKYRARLQWLDKIPDTTPKPAADRGTQIHQEAEDYVRGKGEFTHNLRHFKSDFIALRQHFAEGRVVCEEEWGFDRNWEVVDWNRAWLRLKCDVVTHLSAQHVAVIDHKSGKRFGNELKHAQQLQLYALCTLIRYNRVQQTTNELWYLDHDELASFELKRSQLERYLRIFDRRGRAFTECTEFTPNPNVHTCKWCPYAPHNQGDCKYGVNVKEVQDRQANSIITINNAKKKPMKSDKFFDAEDLSRYV